ncbi:Transposon Tf2-8 poly [Paramuricea clavata]|uniref:Transposon Tf2-8 poly, partial n=1 Tax=Paramuricea clavata TaxID=317549 RepID=A0A6S7LVX1_PARCT|nr:Transposon Tf2-8 poly [Paramuricea clavata]
MSVQGEGIGAVACAKNLVDWIAMFGVPKSVISDRGPQFSSSLWEEVGKILGFKSNLSTAYHPQTNGKVERMHRSLKNALRSRLDGRNDWLCELPWAILGLRNRPNTDSQLSPSELVFGGKVRLPGQPTLPISKIQPATFAEKLKNAVANQDKPTTQWHLAQNSNFNVPQVLKKCEMVLLREERKLSSLRPKYCGPFKVLNRNAKTITIGLPTGEEKVSIDRVKPYFDK